MPALAPIGRVLFALIFLLSAPLLFKHESISAAATAGLPFATMLVPLAGILAFIGGLSVALGYRARWGAVALVLFLVPVTLVMHRFWGISDPQTAQMQMANFLKNMALIGGACFIAYAGAGAYSLDARSHRGMLAGEHGLMAR